MTEIIYKDLSYQVVGCFYKIFNALGPGHKEDIYQKALSIEFEKAGLNYAPKKRIAINYEGKKIGVYEPDFVIDEKIIVEIKSALIIPKVFEKQLFYYLKATGFRLGFLVNFGSNNIDIRRRVL